jgi:hypothetical protein
MDYKIVAVIPMSIALIASGAAQEKSRISENTYFDLTPHLNTEPYIGPYKDDDTCNIGDGYSRLTVKLIGVEKRNARHYKDERRESWERLYFGRSFTRILTIRARIGDGGNNPSVVLASASHESSKKTGEQWQTEGGEFRYLTPYFRLDSSSSINIETTLSFNVRNDSQIGGAALDVVRKGTELLSPSSKLMTTLSEPGLEKAARFFDESISSLFGESVIERSLNDYSMRTLVRPRGQDDGTGRKLLQFEAQFPNKAALKDRQPLAIGKWNVHAEEPVASIFFYARTDCRTPLEAAKLSPDLKRLTPQRILSFNAGANVSVAQLISSDPAISRLTQDVATSKDKEAKKSASTLCNRIASIASSTGFNGLDSSLVVWAYSHSDQVSPSVGNAIRAANCNASQFIKELSLQY